MKVTVGTGPVCGLRADAEAFWLFGLVRVSVAGACIRSVVPAGPIIMAERTLRNVWATCLIYQPGQILATSNHRDLVKMVGPLLLYRGSWTRSLRQVNLCSALAAGCLQFLPM